MDLRRIEMLLAVVECGGYLKAGERLNISHSAIHRQIKLLEHDLKDRVLIRVGQRVRLTETGHIVLRLARRIRQDVSNAQRQIAELNQLQQGTLRIGTGSSILASFLPPILARFQREFPKIEVCVMTGTADQVIEEIHNGHLDLGIIFSPVEVPKGHPVPDYELLYREELVLAVGEGHAFKGQSAISFAQLQSVPINTYTKSSHIRRSIEHVFEKAGVVPTIRMELENEEALMEMVKINMGMAFISKRRVIKAKIPYVNIIDQAVYCQVGVVYPQVEYIPQVVRQVVRLCREGARAYETSSLQAAHF